MISDNINKLGTAYLSMFDMFSAWQQEAEKLKAGQATKEDYNYPRVEAEHAKAMLDARRTEKDTEPTEKQ